MPSIESRPEFLHDNPGTIEVIYGPMFSGKSDELIRRVRRVPFSKQRALVFKPELDVRRGIDTVNTDDGIKYPAISVKTSVEIFDLVSENIQVVGIDEAQFFDFELPYVCDELTKQGKRVIVAGLVADFRNQPFGPMPQILLDADYSDKLLAYCNECGLPASRTQRLVVENGVARPADFDEPIVVVGGSEQYQARCRHCHEVPRARVPEKLSFEE